MTSGCTYRRLLLVSIAAGGVLMPMVRSHATDTETGNTVALTEVVVTARKKSESAQDIPISVDIANGTLLQAFDVHDVTAVQEFVPGMVLSRAPDDGLGLTFRGIGSSPRNQSFESSVGMFLDGVFLGKARLYFVSFYDVDQIEFDKGTQSTLQGKNTSLGAIAITTRKPEDAYGGTLIADWEVANGGGSGEAAVNLPINDTFKVRVAALYTNLHGGFKNDVTGHNLPIDDNAGARVTAQWQPADWVDVSLIYQYFRNLHIGSGSQVVLDPNDVVPMLGPARGTGPCILCTRVSMDTPYGNQGESFKNTHGNMASALLNVRLGEYTVTSQSAYIGYGLHNVDDFDFENNSDVTFLRTESYSQYTEELRVTSPAQKRFEYLSGLFFLGSNWQSTENQLWAVPGFPPPPSPISGQLFNGSFATSFEQKQTSYSMFADGTFRFIDALRGTVGVRESDEFKDIAFGRAALTPLTLWNSYANPPFPITPLRFAQRYLNGNADLQFDITKDLMLYGSYARGTKLGGYADGVTIASGNPEEARIKSEIASTFEVGEKWTLLEGAARLNAALFLTKVQNFQETEFTGVAFLTKNIPLQSKGLDLTTQWQITKSFGVSLGAVYADATDKATRTRAAAAPLWTGNVGGEYVRSLPLSILPMQLSVNSAIHFRSAQYNQIEESIPKTPSLTTVDLSIGVGGEDNRWKVSLITRNVFNRLEAEFGYLALDPFLSANGVVDGEPNPPRSVLLQGAFFFN